MSPDTLKQFNPVINTIKKSNNILLATHEKPDGDGIGSILALGNVLENLGRNIAMFSVNSVPENLRFLPRSMEIAHEINSKDAFDLILLLDCSEPERTGLKQYSVLSTQYSVTSVQCPALAIDHHKTTNKDISGIFDETASSVSEIIYYLLKEMHIYINRDIATYLLTGIFTDTGSFQHANTTQEVLEISSELMKKGAPLYKIAENTYHTRRVSALKIWGRALSRIKINKKTGLVASVVTKEDLEECSGTIEDLEGLVSVISAVSDSKFSLLLTESGDNIIKGSLRSEEDKGIDVSKIAQLLGGGGHILSSGFKVKGKLVETGDGWEVE